MNTRDDWALILCLILVLNMRGAVMASKTPTAWTLAIQWLMATHPELAHVWQAGEAKELISGNTYGVAVYYPPYSVTAARARSHAATWAIRVALAEVLSHPVQLVRVAVVVEEAAA